MDLDRDSRPRHDGVLSAFHLGLDLERLRRRADPGATSLLATRRVLFHRLSQRGELSVSRSARDLGSPAQCPG